MAIIRLRRFGVLAAALALGSTLLAEPPKTSATAQTSQKPASTPAKPVAPRLPGGLQPTVPVIPDHPGIHINSVRVQGSCRQSATTFVVELQNNGASTAPAGVGWLIITAANGGQNHAEIPLLAPGQKRTITIPTAWYVYCENNEVGQPACFDVSVGQNPAVVGAAVNFDGVKHRVCENPPSPANSSTPLITDTPHK